MSENLPIDNPENARSLKLQYLRRDRNRIEGIYKALESKRKKELFCFFQVVLDGITVTTRTDNLDYFWEFLHYLDEYSQTLEILVYKGQSYRNTRHRFSVGRIRPEVLSEEEIERKVEEGVEKWIQDQEYEKTLNENESLKAKVEKLEKENKELKFELEELRNNHFNRDNLAVARILKLLIIEYPTLVKKFPQLKQFNGLFGLEIPEQAGESNPPEADNPKPPQK